MFRQFKFQYSGCLSGDNLIGTDSPPVRWTLIVDSDSSKSSDSSKTSDISESSKISDSSKGS